MQSNTQLNMLPNIQNDPGTAINKTENQYGALERQVLLRESDQMQQKWREIQNKLKKIEQKARETKQNQDDDSAATTDKSSLRKGN